jgi:hypothetical protein
MIREWIGLKRERLSRVTEEQRGRMYVELVERMDGLPGAFLKKAGAGGVEERLS